MSNGVWFRCYCDLPDCIKLRRLPADVQLFYIWCLCLHKAGRLSGSSAADIAWRLRVDADQAGRNLEALRGAGLLEPDNSPTGWNERQFVSDVSTERVRKHRETLQKRSGNVTETPSETETETDTESETESETEGDARGATPPMAAVGCVTNSEGALTLQAPEPTPEPKPAAKLVVNPFRQWNAEQFRAEVEKANADSFLTPAEVDDFLEYWSETTPNGRTRLQLQKTWDTRRRMKTSYEVKFSKQRAEASGGKARGWKEMF